MHLVVYCGKGAVVFNSITGEIDTVLDDVVVDKELQIFRMTFYTLVSRLFYFDKFCLGQIII